MSSISSSIILAVGELCLWWSGEEVQCSVSWLLNAEGGAEVSTVHRVKSAQRTSTKLPTQ